MTEGGAEDWEPQPLHAAALAAGIVVHSDDPLNGETPVPGMPGGLITPVDRFYVRNHFRVPRLDAQTWRLEVCGAVDQPAQLSLAQLRAMPQRSMAVTLECAGDGRVALTPLVEGDQWGGGAVSTAEWTGVPLAELLQRAGPREDAHSVIFRGADSGTAGDVPGTVRYERALTIGEALDSDGLLAYAMNGAPLPPVHGFPLRLVLPAWYAMASVKWLTQIELSPEPFHSYWQDARYVYEWRRNGVTVREPVRLMRVRSLITEPVPGAQVSTGTLLLRGVAWSGDGGVRDVHVQAGDGDWRRARLLGEPGSHHWQWWEAELQMDGAGMVALRSRATDAAGNTQPEQPVWNRHGYGCNAITAITVQVGNPMMED